MSVDQKVLPMILPLQRKGRDASALLFERTFLLGGVRVTVGVGRGRVELVIEERDEPQAA